MLASYSFAMHIIAPSKLAENAVLYFNIDFEDEQFDSVKILIDGKEVLQAFSNMQIAIFKKNVISAFFVDEDPNSNTGLVLHVVYVGLQEGTHTIKAITYLNGAEQNQTSADISIFSPAASSELTSLETTLESRISSAEQNISNIQSSLSTISTTTNNLSQDIESIKKETSGFKDSFNNVFRKFETYDKKLADLENKNSELNKLIEDLEKENLSLKGELQLLQEELEKRTTVTSFIALENTSLFIGLVILIILAIVVYTKREKIKELFSRKEEVDLFPEEEPEEKSKRWQFEDKGSKENEEQRFSLADLIKREE